MMRESLRALVCSAAIIVVTACGRIDPAVEVAEANERFAAGDYRTAMIHVGNVLQSDPSNAQGRRLRGRIALIVGDAAVAVAELERARELGVPAQDLAVDLAAALALAGDNERALLTLDETAGAYAYDARYWAVRGRALAGLGRFAEAEQAYAASGGRSVESLIGLSELAVIRDARDDARRFVDEAAVLAPDDPQVFAARGALAVRYGRNDEAVIDLAKAAELYGARPPSAQEAATLFVLVQVHLAANRSAAAADVAKHLAARIPGAAIGEFAQAMVAYEDGRLDVALDLMRSVLRKEPGNPRYLVVMGALQLAAGNLGQAEQSLLNAVAAAPNDSAAVQLLAETRLRQQRPDAALESLARLTDAALNDAQTRTLNGLANLQAGNLEAAVQNFERAIALDPGNRAYHLNLARAYLAAGRNADAMALLDDGAIVPGDSELASQSLRLVAYLQAGDVEGGRAYARQLVADLPGRADALAMVAVFHQLVGEPDVARARLEEAVSIDDGYQPARMLLAELLVQEGRTAEAENHLREAAAAGGGYAPAMVALAQRVAVRGAFDEAEQLLLESIERSPNVTARLILARLQTARGRFDAASEQIAMAETAAPDSPDVTAARGLLALASGRAAEAVGLLQRAHGAMPARIDVVLALAQAQAANADLASARTTLASALAAAPQSRQLAVALGAAELALGNVDEATRIAADLRVSFPAAAAGDLLDGDVQMSQRRFDQAIEAYARAADREPSWSVVQRQVRALQSAGRAEEARVLLEAWVEREPQRLQSRLLLAALLVQEGRSADALVQYQNALEIDPDDFATLNDAAWLSNELGAPNALELAERAFAVAPQHPSVLDTLGWILIEQNREQAAIEHLEKAAQLAPQEPEIQYHLAVAQSRVGRADEARATLAALLGRGQPFASREAAQDLLESL